jgi:hypothetical protein
LKDSKIPIDIGSRHRSFLEKSSELLSRDWMRFPTDKKSFAGVSRRAYIFKNLGRLFAGNVIVIETKNLYRTVFA